MGGLDFLREPPPKSTRPRGAATGEAGYVRRIREIGDQYGVLLILDEVMSGLGRTGYHHAFEAEGIVPDMVTLAKGLAGGYQPIGAVLVADRIFDALDQGTRFLQHALTYSGHPVAAAAALSVQKTIVEEGLLDNVTQMGNRLKRGLTERLGEHAYVADIRGRGLLQAIEIVDKAQCLAYHRSEFRNFICGRF